MGSESDVSGRQLREGVTSVPFLVLKRQLGFLFRKYIRNPSRQTARLIVDTLENILFHPDNDDDVSETCNYHKLLLQWRIMS